VLALACAFRGRAPDVGDMSSLPREAAYLPVCRCLALHLRRLDLIWRLSACSTSRSDSMHQVNKKVQQLTKGFERLNDLIHEQDEVIQRLDDNIVSAEGFMEDGQKTLISDLEGISGSKTMIMKVLGVVTVFSVGFITFFV
jgi:hypothetical protein